MSSFLSLHRCGRSATWCGSTPTGPLNNWTIGTMARRLLFASAPAGQFKRVAEGSGLQLTWNQVMRKALRELGIEQEWESECHDGLAWRQKVGLCDI